MKNALVSIAFAVAVLHIAGGPVTSQESIRIDPEYYCAAEPGSVPERLNTFPPTPRAERAIEEIVDLVGLGTSGWRLLASSQAKASASMDSVTGERRIVYNEDFIRNLRGESDSVWANVAILAHEVAHHLNNHLQTGDSETRQIEELEADRFAGYVLFRKGASEEATQRVFRTLGGGRGGYPPVADRVAAARNGWLRGEALGTRVVEIERIIDTDVVPVDPPPPPPPRVSGLALRAEHGGTVLHMGGGAPAPGFQFHLQGRLEYENPAIVYVGIHFWFPGGRIVLAHPQEQYYRRASNNQVATGVPGFRFAGGRLNLGSLLVDSLPYYVLNLGPSAYRRYDLVARAFVYVDEALIASSRPEDLWVVW